MAVESSSNRGKKESTLVLWNSPRHKDYVEDSVKSPPHSPNNSSTRKKRSEKAEVRDAACEAALREIKERIKKTKDEKKAKKAEAISKQKTQSNVPNGGAVSKGPKIGGGGGKR
ncbi:hypothetical protein ACS0TY_014910 [Phlomoides rotata]